MAEGSGVRQGGPDHVVDEVVGEHDALFPLIDSIRSIYGTLVSLPAGIWHFDELASRGKETRLSSVFLLAFSFPRTYMSIYLRLAISFCSVHPNYKFDSIDQSPDLSHRIIAFENLLHRFAIYVRFLGRLNDTIDAFGTEHRSFKHNETKCLSSQRKA